jgi:hypothetical protein
MKRVGLIVLLFLLFSTYAWAQSPKPTSIAELATYAGADREQLLYAGAKSEGTVTWYTSLAGDSYKAIARAFEAKYPGVRVESYRAGGSELVVRMAEETKARRPTFDALETMYDFMMVSRANNLTRPYNSPVLASYPAEAKEKADKGLTFWTIFRESYMGFGYNKDQVPAGAVPKGFDGLLHPQLKGKMGVTLNEKFSPHDRRDAEDQRRRVCKEIKGPGNPHLHSQQRGSCRSDGFGRAWRFTSHLPQSCYGLGGTRIFGGMGADGAGSDQQWLCRSRRPTAAPTCGCSFRRLPSRHGGAQGAGKIPIRPSVTGMAVQALASGIR